MPQHDAYARYTPYELALPGRDFARERFEAIAREIETRGVATGEPATFVMVKAVHDALEELGGPDRDSESTREHAVLLYHAFHFHRADEPLYLLGTHAARYLVEADPVVDVSPRTPTPAGYLQLPQHLFWAQPRAEGSPEPVDGFFWCTPAEGLLSVLVVVGMRGGRPGLSLVELPPVPMADAGTWAVARTREEGSDFAGTLPGAELERLYSLETAGEVLKLLARAFWYLEAHPRMVREEPGQGAWTDPRSPGEPPAHDGPRPSSLPFRRILLKPDIRVEAPEEEA